MSTQRWLVEYDATSNVVHLVDQALASEVQIVGVFQDALALIAEGSESKVQRWLATVSVKHSRTGPYPEEEITQEVNLHRRELMKYWNEQLANSPQQSHPHEGLSWDHPGFSPPDLPDIIPGRDTDW